MTDRFTFPTHFNGSDDRFRSANAYGLSLLSQLAYEDPSSATFAAGIAALGLTPARPFAGGPTSGFATASGDDVFLVFRGTKGAVDWGFDLTVAPVPALGGLVHLGFKLALEAAWSQTVAAVKAAAPSGAFRLWLCGHSLGGALSILASAQWAASRLMEGDRLAGMQDRAKLQSIYTYGGPCVGDGQFRDTLLVPCHRVVNNNDFVAWVLTTVPPYVHVGEMRYIDSSGKLRDGISAAAVAADRLAGIAKVGPGEPFIDHDILQYQRWLAEAVGLPSSAPQKP